MESWDGAVVEPRMYSCPYTLSTCMPSSASCLHAQMMVAAAEQVAAPATPCACPMVRTWVMPMQYMYTMQRWHAGAPCRLHGFVSMGVRFQYPAMHHGCAGQRRMPRMQRLLRARPLHRTLPGERCQMWLQGSRPGSGAGASCPWTSCQVRELLCRGDMQDAGAMARAKYGCRGMHAQRPCLSWSWSVLVCRKYRISLHPVALWRSTGDGAGASCPWTSCQGRRASKQSPGHESGDAEAMVRPIMGAVQLACLSFSCFFLGQVPFFLFGMGAAFQQWCCRLLLHGPSCQVGEASMAGHSAGHDCWDAYSVPNASAEACPEVCV